MVSTGFFVDYIICVISYLIVTVTHFSKLDVLSVEQCEHSKVVFDAGISCKGLTSLWLYITKSTGSRTAYLYYKGGSLVFVFPRLSITIKYIGH